MDISPQRKGLKLNNLLHEKFNKNENKVHDLDPDNPIVLDYNKETSGNMLV